MYPTTLGTLRVRSSTPQTITRVSRHRPVPEGGVNTSDYVSTRDFLMKEMLPTLIIAAAWATPTSAQSAKIEERPPMYTIVASWELDKAFVDTNKAFAASALIGYGTNETLLHQIDGSTHAMWWSAMSMAAVLNVLEEVHKTSAPLLNRATKHWDGIYVSRFYNWHPGSSHGAYTQATSFRLKAGAPDDAVAVLCKSIFVPLFEKLLADGTLIEYEVDVQAEHTEAPDTFWISVITAKAEGLDKVNAAIAETFNTNPLVGPTFGSAVDFAVHRDYLYRTEATYR